MEPSATGARNAARSSRVHSRRGCRICSFVQAFEPLNPLLRIRVKRGLGMFLIMLAGCTTHMVHQWL